MSLTSVKGLETLVLRDTHFYQETWSSFWWILKLFFGPSEMLMLWINRARRSFCCPGWLSSITRRKLDCAPQLEQNCLCLKDRHSLEPSKTLLTRSKKHYNLIKTKHSIPDPTKKRILEHPQVKDSVHVYSSVSAALMSTRAKLAQKLNCISWSSRSWRSDVYTRVS